MWQSRVVEPTVDPRPTSIEIADLSCKPPVPQSYFPNWRSYVNGTPPVAQPETLEASSDCEKNASRFLQSVRQEARTQPKPARRSNAPKKSWQSTVVQRTVDPLPASIEIADLSCKPPVTQSYCDIDDDIDLVGDASADAVTVNFVGDVQLAVDPRHASVEIADISGAPPEARSEILDAPSLQHHQQEQQQTRDGGGDDVQSTFDNRPASIEIADLSCEPPAPQSYCDIDDDIDLVGDTSADVVTVNFVGDVQLAVDPRHASVEIADINGAPPEARSEILDAPSLHHHQQEQQQTRDGGGDDTTDFVGDVQSTFDNRPASIEIADLSCEPPAPQSYCDIDDDIDLVGDAGADVVVDLQAPNFVNSEARPETDDAPSDCYLQEQQQQTQDGGEHERKCAAAKFVQKCWRRTAAQRLIVTKRTALQKVQACARGWIVRRRTRSVLSQMKEQRTRAVVPPPPVIRRRTQRRPQVATRRSSRARRAPERFGEWVDITKVDFRKIR